MGIDCRTNPRPTIKWTAKQIHIGDHVQLLADPTAFLASILIT
jgi:hypothetical protein